MNRCLLLSFVFFYLSLEFAQSATEKKLEIKVGNGVLCGVYSYNSKIINKIVIIIPGSGPTDRNGNNPYYSCNNLKTISDSLILISGVATFRFDKRGIGESIFLNLKEESLTFDTYVEDVERWFRLLKSMTSVKDFYILGHSEGSLIGILVSQKISVQGFISISGAGHSAKQILKKQLQSTPVNMKERAYAIIDSIDSGKEVKKVDASLAMLFRPSVQPYLRSWFKYEPTKEITKINCPILIIYGGMDNQVDSTEAESLCPGDCKAKKIFFKNMNHFLQTSTSDFTFNPNEPVHEGLINCIKKFIKK